MENELAKAQGRLATAERSSETRREHISALKNELEISRMEIAEVCTLVYVCRFFA